MKLHYKGKYDLNPDSLPHGEHRPNAVPFNEPSDSKQFSILMSVLSLIIIVLLFALAFTRYSWSLLNLSFSAGAICSMLSLFPHELLHAICFKHDVYIYTNLAQGMLFVTGPEDMSKGRFIFMSLLPNILFGFIPYILGMLSLQPSFLIAFGTLCIGMGAGDYFNVFNAVVQMPKGARTYIHKFNSFWYMP